MTQTNSLILSERRGAILLITLNRADKRNALHPDLVRELSGVLASAELEPGLNVVVLTGAGPSFCAGLDLNLLIGMTPDEKASYLTSVLTLLRQIYTLKQPVIAAINGAAIAGGFDLAALCDIRLCAPQATFAQAEINLGLTQIIYPLYKSIGLGRAKELALTGAVITAEEAYRIGLANHIYPSEELLVQAMKLAETLAAKPREALFETKRLSRELIEMDAESAFQRMAEAILNRLRSDEHREQAREFVARLKSQK